uniref:Mei2-like C-terminal RNA recognition motif domain-containing protein n=1 Tax=Strombidinopsis acuminata TaxID=141414 RepID=A0A7S3SZF3_9SPIT
MSELDEEDDELYQGEKTPEHLPATSLMSPISVALPVAASEVASTSSGHAHYSSHHSRAAKPQVLLLSESIPLRRGGNDKERSEKRDARKDSHINQMKNNDITRKEPPWTDVTTVMMRNLPNKYTQQMLLEELADSGFRLQADLDFFYLPMDHSNAANLGYCFINFVETAMANAFAAAFQGKKMRRFNSNKTVVVMPASIQGFDRNYAYYSSTRVAQAEDPQYRPLFLRPPPDGQAPSAGKHQSARAQAGAKGRVAGAAAAGMGGAAAAQPRGKKGAKARAENSGWAAGAMPDPSNAMGSYMDWSAMGGAWPMQSVPAPTPQQSSPLASQPQQKICGKCNNECNATHRFCAFCGSFIGSGPGGGGGGGGGLRHEGLMNPNSGMRADAPTFMPHMPGGSPSGARGNSSLMRPDAQEGGAPQSLLAGLPYPESVTDELDVMRGRMMLLAALKDIEKRGGGGAGGAAGQRMESGADDGDSGLQQALRW